MGELPCGNSTLLRGGNFKFISLFVYLFLCLVVFSCQNAAEFTNCFTASKAAFLAIICKEQIFFFNSLFSSRITVLPCVSLGH